MSISQTASKTLNPSPPDRLVMGARELIAAKGVQGVTARSVAEAAQVSAAAINYYFDGQEGLIAAAFDSAAQEARAGFDRDLEALSRLSLGPEHFADWFAACVLDQGAAGRSQAMIRRDLFLYCTRRPGLLRIAREWSQAETVFAAATLERFGIEARFAPVMREALQGFGDLFFLGGHATLQGAVAGAAARHLAARLSRTPAPAGDWRHAGEAALAAHQPISPLADARGPAAQRLLDSAARLVGREGVAALTYRSLAKESGLAPTLALSYFGNRESLLLAIFQYIHQRLSAKIPEEGGDPSALMTRDELIEAYGRVMLDDEGAIRADAAMLDEMLVAARRDESLSGLAAHLVIGRGAVSYATLSRLSEKAREPSRMDGFVMTLCGIAALSGLRVRAPADRLATLRADSIARLDAITIG